MAQSKKTYHTLVSRYCLFIVRLGLHVRFVDNEKNYKISPDFQKSNLCFLYKGLYGELKAQWQFVD